MDRLNVSLEVVASSEPFGTLLTGERFRGCLVVFVPCQDVSSQVVLLGKLLTALSAVERSNLFVNSGHVLLQMIFPRESVLADVTLPISSFLFFRFSVFADCDAAADVSHDNALTRDGVTKRHAAVLVLAVKSRRVELVLLLGGARHLVHGRDVALKRRDACKDLETLFSQKVLKLTCFVVI